MNRRVIAFVLAMVMSFSSGIFASNSSPTPGKDRFRNNLYPNSRKGSRHSAHPFGAAGPQSIATLLQGKWQSKDDKTNFLIFTGNHRKEIAAGMDKWDDEIFVLSDKCLNDADKDKEITPEQDMYISCAGSDMCWYIVSVNKKNLTLSYMGRGNTLRYKRVK